MTTKRKLLATFFASLVVVATPTALLHWVGLITIVAAVTTVVLLFFGYVRAPRTLTWYRNIFIVLVVAIAFFVGAATVKLWAAFAFWVTVIILLVPWMKRVLGRISAFISRLRSPHAPYPPSDPGEVPTDDDSGDDDDDDEDDDS